MKSGPKLLLVLLLGAASLAAATLAGCGNEEREQIVAAVGIQPLLDVRASVAAKIDNGKFMEARQEAEAFLNGGVDKSGRLAWALAKACAQLGDHDRALGYVVQAVNAGAVSNLQVMDEPLLGPLHSDMRLVSIAASVR